MAKKGDNVVKIQVEAKNPPRKKAKSRPKPAAQSAAVTKALIENSIAMQRVYVTIAEKLDKLSNQLSTLLNLFETAAKSFAENPALHVLGTDREFLEKINRLLEQDKVIAKTLMLMDERMKAKEAQAAGMPAMQPTPPAPEEMEFRPAMSAPMPPQQQAPPQQKKLPAY